MGLTVGPGPLGRAPENVNYEISGPPHKLLFQAFPRRVRARLGGETVLDTRAGKLLHETGILPRLYAPLENVRMDLLERTSQSTHCPFKGDASYWTVRAGGREAKDAVWGYEHPIPAAAWLAGHVSVDFDAMDEWLDEEEPVSGHLRDPYHRVDVRRSSRHVRVAVAGELVAESERPLVLSETGLPNRWYLPPESVRDELLEPSQTSTHCPYKGDASWRSALVGERRIEDVAWLYPAPFGEAQQAAGHLSFDGDDVTVEVDGAPV